MVSFLKKGFVVQDSAGRYELGPLALQIGLAKLQRLDPIKEAASRIEPLAAEIGQSIAVVVWGNLGATIVRMEELIQPLHVNLRTGTVMSISQTAMGRLFAAYLPHMVVEKLMVEDIGRFGGGSGDRASLSIKQVEALINETRRHGLSRTLGHPIPCINAFCAPVFDFAGNIVLGISAIGPAATFDISWKGKVAVPLRACAQMVSSRLGYVAVERLS